MLILALLSHPATRSLTLISFPQPVSFTFPKSRWRSQYVRDEYFISCMWVGGRAVITRGGSAAQPCLGRRGRGGHWQLDLREGSCTHPLTDLGMGALERSGTYTSCSLGPLIFLWVSSTEGEGLCLRVRGSGCAHQRCTPSCELSLQGLWCGTTIPGRKGRLVRAFRSREGEECANSSCPPLTPPF